jgi:large subunit ribosomal protein L15
MKLNTLTRYKKANKRLGRGRATGVGKTSGRGHKGQKSRAGKKLRAGFEGGQTPIFQRLPKYRGFTNPNYVEYQVLNVSDLEKLGEKTVNQEVLLASGLIKKKDLPVKILGNGEISKAVDVTVEKASQSAIDKITKAGGKFVSNMKESVPKAKKEKSVSETPKAEAAAKKEEVPAEEQ